jgi:hypothetical protein
MSPRRTIPYDAQISLDLWVQIPHAVLRLHLIEVVQAIA